MPWQRKASAETDGFNSSLIVNPVVVTASHTAWLIVTGASG
jgi:hypothetical protein